MHTLDVLTVKKDQMQSHKKSEKRVKKNEEKKWISLNLTSQKIMIRISKFPIGKL